MPPKKKGTTTPRKKAPAKKTKKQAGEENEEEVDEEENYGEEQLPGLNIDGKFSTYYLRLEKQDPEVIRFFKRTQKNTNRKTGESEDKIYYTLHGISAKIMAEEYFKTETVLKTIPMPKEYVAASSGASSSLFFKKKDDYSGGFPSLSARDIHFEEFVCHLLQNRQVRIEVYDTAEEGGWKRIKAGGPGNTEQFEDIIFAHSEFSTQDNSITMSVKISQSDNTVGVAFCDTMRRILSVIEFVDNDQFSLLETLVTQQGAKGCYIHLIPKDERHKKVQDVLKRSEVAINLCNKDDFKTNDLQQDLAKLLSENVKSLINFEENQLAMAALACLLRQLQLVESIDNHQYYHLRKLKHNQFMKLDASAIRALNIVQSPTDTRKTMNLQGLLSSHAKTFVGRRLLATWIRQPLLDIKEINDRHDVVEAFVEDEALRKQIQEDFLKHIPDFTKLIKRFHKLQAKLQDCCEVYKFLIKVPALLTVLNSYSGDFSDKINEYFTNPLTLLHSDLDKFIKLVETSVDLSGLAKDEYNVNPQFDPALDEIKAEKDDIYTQMLAQADEVREALSLDEGAIEVRKNAMYGHFFFIKKKDFKNVEKQLKSDYQVLQSTKTDCKFTSREMKTLSNSYKEVCENYETKSGEVIRSVVQVAASYCSTLEEISECMAKLDVLIAFATLATQATRPYVRPRMKALEDPNAEIVLKDSRHPCLEVQEVGTHQFIENDLVMKKGESSFVIITGPNMGGKSTYIRQVGLVVLMAQIGCFIPCSDAVITVCDCILARIGASDAQSRGVSTFMAEMLETSTILKTATSHSLIIIDELGRGTSTFDGFGLAYAISEHIIQEIKCFCFFATHFHELTSLEKYHKDVKNLHVEAETTENTITMKYKIKDKASSKSFGIHVATLAKFPKEVIQVAKRKASELEEDQVKPAAKRQRIRGGAEIKSFLKLVCQQDIAGMADTELIGLLGSFNSRIQEIDKTIASGSSQTA